MSLNISQICEEAKEILNSIGSVSSGIAAVCTIIGTIIACLYFTRKSANLIKKSLYSSKELPDWYIWFSVYRDLAFCAKLSLIGYLKRTNNSSNSKTLISLENLTRMRVEYEFLCKRPENKDDLKRWFELMEEKMWDLSRRELGDLIVSVDNCFIIQNSLEKINLYLKLTRELNYLNSGEFILSVNVLDGFITPLYLLCGPLKYFEADWPKLANLYQNSFDGDIDEIESIKRSNLSTWLAWGPSIPLCKCEKWTRERAKYPRFSNKDFLVRTTFQYGYGDENNSIRILLPKKKCVEEFIKKFNKLISENSEDNASPLAVRSTITGKLALLERQSVLAPYPLVEDYEEKIYDTELFLSCDDENIQSFAQSASQIKSRYYYTTYVWILFEVIDREVKETAKEFSKENHLKVDGDKPWRKLLPFFEHANIADKQTYETSKNILVYKSLNFIKTMQGKKITFRYLCSFDHTNCSHTGGLIIESYEKEQKTILDLIREAVAKDFKDSLLPLVLPENQNDDSRSHHYPDLNSCHLNDFMNKLNNELEQATQ
jgi:hypothetical protein